MILGEISLILFIHHIIFIIIGSGINNQYKALISDNYSEYLTWGNFYSNEFSCLQLDIEDLLNEDYSFNITCSYNSTYFYLSKFGISPIDLESENIANCYAKTYKNLINIDAECDLSEFLEEKLKFYKHKNQDIEINIKEMNISNEILYNCNNINNKKKFFLTYSCYISNYTLFNYDISKNSIAWIYLVLEHFSLLLVFLRIVFFRKTFIEKYNSNNSLKIKNLTLMIDTINVKNDIPFFINELLFSIKKKILDIKIVSKNEDPYSLIKEINFSIINQEEKELYDNFNHLLRKRECLKEKI